MSLINRATQLRVRRKLRRRQKQVETAAGDAVKRFDTDVINRFDRLLRVRRFVLAWTGLIVLTIVCVIIQTLHLNSYYQHTQPAAGGIYNEGMVGTYSNANPLYASGAVDTAVSRLVFAGLLRYNSHNNLVGDLATGYTVDKTGKHYVAHLRTGLTWQDGRPLTAKDVVFTYHLIQNPDVGSPLMQSWQNIVITAPDKYTVDFVLPNAFAAFPYNLTTGILPEHILSHVPVAQLRSNAFNTTEPVGAGPFAWQAIQTTNAIDPDKTVSLIALTPFKHYAGGAPKLSGFVLHAYGSQSELIDAFKHRDVNAVAGLQEVPGTIAKLEDMNAIDFPSTAAVMTFFKTSDGVLADKQVRLALTQGADTEAVLHSLPYVAKAVQEPLLQGQIGYDAAYHQAAYNPAKADATLTAAGWIRGADGVRSKDGHPLAFQLYAQDTRENRRTARILVHDWKKLGAKVTPVFQSIDSFQTTLQFHSYEALLYGISIGADPDVFAYWDSSQADIRSTTRLNFSEYQSSTADTALEAGRTRLDPALRTIKYRPFLQAWRDDAPALGLYQPRFLYITRGTVYGLDKHTLNADSDRYDSVQNWEILTTRVTDN